MSSRSVIYGKYELLQRINVGGMAEVFKARTVEADGSYRYVAIKRILPSIAEDRDFINMFIDEAKICVQLEHPNIAHTYELGNSNDTYYIAMEYIPGKDLRTIFERLRRHGRVIPPEIVAYVVASAAAGLDYAHHKADEHGQPLGIVHRDVSPQNILVSFDGDVKIIDFGIAKAENKIQRTQVGVLKGKFGYMSPEQVAGKPIDDRSDLFSLGVVLFELLAGERLFVGTNDHSVLDKVRNVDIPELPALRPDVPPAVLHIVSKALTKDPDRRYQRASEISEALNEFLALGSPVTRETLASFMRTTLAEDYQHEQRISVPEPQVPDEPDWPRGQPSLSVPKIRATLLQHDQRPSSEDQRPSLEGAAPTASISSGGEGANAGAEVVESLRLNLAALSHDTDPNAHVESPEPPHEPPVSGEKHLDISHEALMFEAEMSRGDGARLVGLSAAAHSAGSAPELRIVPRSMPEPPLPAPPPPEEKPAPPPRPLRLTPVPRMERGDVTRVAVVPPETFRPQRAIADEPTTVGPAPARPKKRRVPWVALLAVVLLFGGLGALAIYGLPEFQARQAQLSQLDLFAAPGYAGLEVKTDPVDAQVFLDGTMVKPGSVEPFRSEHIDSDMSHIVIARKAGYHESSQTLTLGRGETRLVEMTLLPDAAVLRVETTPPNAEVWIDGVMEGHSGEAIGTVTPGKHQLSINLDCYKRITEPVNVTSAGLQMRFTLTQLPGACAVMPGQLLASYGRLTLYSDPPSARVFVDDRDLKQLTPVLDLRLAPGRHRVKLVAETASKETEIDVRAGRSTSQTVMLDPIRRR